MVMHSVCVCGKCERNFVWSQPAVSAVQWRTNTHDLEIQEGE